MREFFVLLGRNLVTTGALAFGYWAFRLEDGWLIPSLSSSGWSSPSLRDQQREVAA